MTRLFLLAGSGIILASRLIPSIARGFPIALQNVILYAWLSNVALELCVNLIPSTIYVILRLSLVQQQAGLREQIRAEVKREEAVPDSQQTQVQPEASLDDSWEHVKDERPEDDKQKVQQKRNVHVDIAFDGFIGFFHPFANAGGGGERVLWAAIKATQEKFPAAVIVIYTGDFVADKAKSLARVKSRFDIDLHAPTIKFLYLQRRNWVVASSYPRLTLLLQSVGSMFLAHEALKKLSPDIFIDTMGYAFSTWYCRKIFPSVPIASYVHYPFIGTHMIDSLESDAGHGVNAGSGKGLRGWGKKLYWVVLLRLYASTGTAIDSVMTNSTWTKAHMQRIWGFGRQRCKQTPVTVVYPPCSVEEIIEKTPNDGNESRTRESIILCIAQFRPEKDHEMLIRAYADFVHHGPRLSQKSRLALAGSVRDSDDETLVYKLRILAKELKVDGHVDFLINCSWSEIIDLLQRSWIGVNGMWCEHFGIGVVEYQAAGLISVVNNSGGPKEDIVVEIDGQITGYHASTISQYADAFAQAFSLDDKSTSAIRQRSQVSSKRFTTKIFCAKWNEQLDILAARLPKSIQTR